MRTLLTVAGYGWIIVLALSGAMLVDIASVVSLSMLPADFDAIGNLFIAIVLPITAVVVGLHLLLGLLVFRARWTAWPLYGLLFAANQALHLRSFSNPWEDVYRYLDIFLIWWLVGALLLLLVLRRRGAPQAAPSAA